MSYIHDIDFAKLSLIFNFTTREKIFECIREVSILEELGLNKKLVHVLYERNILTKEQIQAILWGLFCKKRIKRFPSRIAYHFTTEDDEKFLEKVGIPFEQILEQFRQKNKKLQIKTISSIFPLEELLTGIDIQKKLISNNLPRALLSVLSSKGYIKANHHDLIDKIDEKRIVLASPIDVQLPENIMLWETLLFKHLLPQECEKNLDAAFNIWKKVNQQYKLNIRFSEILFYGNYVDKNTLSKTGIALYTLTQIDQILRPSFVELNNEAKQQTQKHLQKPNALATCKSICQELQEIGLSKIQVENIAVHQSFSKNLSTNALSKETPGLLYKNWNNVTKKKITKEFVSFPVNSLEKELQNQYKLQRKLFLQTDSLGMQEFVTEWSQTKAMPIIPTEEISISYAKEADSNVVNTNIISTNVINTIENTDYISIKVTPVSNIKKIENTNYIPIDATKEELRVIGNKIGKSINKLKPIKSMFLLSFLLAVNIGYSYFYSFSQECSTLLTFLCFLLPFILGSIVVGRSIDRETTRINLFAGLYLHILGIVAILFTTNTSILYLLHALLGLAFLQTSLGILYLLIQWFPAIDTRKVLSFFIFTICIGGLCGTKMYYYLETSSEFMVITILSGMVLFSFFIHRFSVTTIENEENKEKESSLEIVHVTPLLFSICFSYLVSILTTNNLEVSWGTTSNIVLAAFISGFLVGLLLFSVKKSTIFLLRIISFFLICTVFFTPFYITNEKISFVFLFLGLWFGGLLFLGFLWSLDKENDNILGESIGVTLTCLAIGFVLGFSAEIIYDYFTIPEIFLFMTLIFIFYFYITLTTPIKEISSVEETKLGGLLSLLKQ